MLIHDITKSTFNNLKEGKKRTYKIQLRAVCIKVNIFKNIPNLSYVEVRSLWVTDAFFYRGWFGKTSCLLKCSSSKTIGQRLTLSADI